MEVCTTCGNPIENEGDECRHCRALKTETVQRKGRTLADREERDKREKEQRQKDMEFEPVTQLDVERKKIITISVIVALVAIVIAVIAMVVMGGKSVDAMEMLETTVLEEVVESSEEVDILVESDLT